MMVRGDDFVGSRSLCCAYPGVVCCSLVYYYLDVGTSGDLSFPLYLQSSRFDDLYLRASSTWKAQCVPEAYKSVSRA